MLLLQLLLVVPISTHPKQQQRSSHQPRRETAGWCLSQLLS
jgi:hypothetical protein